MGVVDTMATFETDFEKYLEKLGVKRVVVFIDDLDRCQSAKIIETFETIKLFLNIPECTFVLGAEGETDDEALETLAFIDRLDPDIAVFIVFMEDRETMSPRRAEHREALLALLRREAPKRPGWVVPELDIRFGDKVTRFIRREHVIGPAWLHLAKRRREVWRTKGA